MGTGMLELAQIMLLYDLLHVQSMIVLNHWIAMRVLWLRLVLKGKLKFYDNNNNNAFLHSLDSILCWDRYYPLLCNILICHLAQEFNRNHSHFLDRERESKKQMSYLKFGKGRLCTGQSNVMLSLNGTSMVRLLSPVVIFGLMLAIGSTININLIKWK